jgi:hypothetical protein
MLTTTRKPAAVGEILVEEFMQPMGLTQAMRYGGEGVRHYQLNLLDYF